MKWSFYFLKILQVLEFYIINNNIESIIQEIPGVYASRPTIFKIIDDAITKKYLKKVVNDDDKRKYNLFPTKQTVKEFEDWSKVFQGFWTSQIFV